MLAGVVLIPILIGAATVALTRSDPRVLGMAPGDPRTRGPDPSRLPVDGGHGTAARLPGGPRPVTQDPLPVPRRTEDHVPLLVKPGGYEMVVRDLQAALAGAGLEMAAQSAPPSMTVPARILARIAGPEADALVPDGSQLTQPDLNVYLPVRPDGRRPARAGPPRPSRACQPAHDERRPAHRGGGGAGARGPDRNARPASSRRRWTDARGAGRAGRDRCRARPAGPLVRRLAGRLP